jgi:hypothetical protein
MMRYRVRIQPYVSPDVHRKLRAYAAAQGLTDSAVTEAALVEYFARGDVEDGPVSRRLDGIAEAIARLQSDLDILSQAFGIFARYSFVAAQAPKGPTAVRQGEALYTQFLGGVSRQVGAGVRFAGEVRRAGLSQPSPPASSRAPEGGRERDGGT